jgi:MerR family transcriptional regulator, redox-sensitive transcriptional activator SoxR
MTQDWLSIGDVAKRTGVEPSALRFYEAEGLIGARRTAGGQRRFARDVLRRIAFIRVAQRVGLSLSEIREALSKLPDGRTPTPRDWQMLSKTWRSRLDDQIAMLERLRDNLTSCIGCGCLSLGACALYNPHDRASTLGAGPRYLLGDAPADLPSPGRTA